MADPARRRRENVAGAYFVDETCIDCDTCRWMAPRTFARRGGKSAVVTQPPLDDVDAAAALVACPTASIGGAPAPVVQAATAAFPRRIDGPVHHAGFHDRRSFGATSYFVERAEGNLLIDVPRFARPLVEAIHARGGLAAILLTHGDDVGEHGRWAKEFGAPRVIHEGDLDAAPDAETVLRSEEPVELHGVTAIPVPGHTRGSVCYLYGPYLFTGDHLAARGDGLRAFRGACWYDWDVQTASMERLLDHEFSFVLPGHGRRLHASSKEMDGRLRHLINWMKSPTTM